MEVILLSKVRNLGNIGDKVSVKPGYGRNYLVPQGKAVSATAENVKNFELRRAELERAANEALAAAKSRAEKLGQLTVIIRAKAAEEGKLFGSVGTREIVKAISALGQEVEKSEIEMPEGAIRQIGEYPIVLRLYGDINVNIKVSVIAEEAAQ